MTTSTSRGRPRSFDRAAALDAAIHLFWKNGYAETSIRDLSEALGIGTPSLYNTFGDKQTLFTEAVRVYDREYGGFIEQALEEEKTAAKAVARILSQAPARYTRSGMPRGCLVSGGDAGLSDPMVCQTLRQVRQHKVQLIADKIRADVAQKRLPTDTDAVGLARFVMVMLTGMTQQARDGVTQDELEKIAQRAIDAWP